MVILSCLCSLYLSLTATLGTLDFSLLYDQENNALHCTINKAKVSRRRRDDSRDANFQPLNQLLDEAPREFEREIPNAVSGLSTHSHFHFFLACLKLIMLNTHLIPTGRIDSFTSYSLLSDNNRSK